MSSQIKFLRSINLISTNCLTPPTVTVIPRRFDQWGPRFELPVFKKSEIEQLKRDGEFQKKAHVMIRSALNRQRDSVFYDDQFQRFLSMTTRKGKLDISSNLLTETFAEIKITQLQKYFNAKTDEDKEAIELDPLKVFHTALANVKPVVIVKSIRRGGASYQVPHAISASESERIGMKWLLDVIKDRPKPRKEYFPSAMARELLEASQLKGKTVKKKQDLHKLCEANRAFAHYRWS